MAAHDDKANRPDLNPLDDEQSGDGGPAEAARFISEMAMDLALLARRHRLDLLAHLLEMSRLEAEDIARRHIDPNLN